MTVLQDGLRGAYLHARIGLGQAAIHQQHNYDVKVKRVPSTKLGIWCGSMIVQLTGDCAGG